VFKGEVIEGGQQFAVSQVAGGPEDDHDAWFGAALHANSLSQGIGSLYYTALRHVTISPRLILDNFMPHPSNARDVA
jgi:hypothetical protein